MPLLSIVIPALNEERGIGRTLDAIPFQALKKLGYGIEVLVVDGNSTDHTVDLAQEAGARVIIESRRGYGRAYKTGFGEARGEVIATADADGSYPVEMLPRLLEYFQKEKLGFLTTNRFAHMHPGSMSLRNRLGNSALSLTSKLLFGLPFSDSQSGMWVLHKSSWDAVQRKVHSDGMAFSQELKIEMHRAGLKCQEFDISYAVREGKPKLNPWRDGLGNLAAMVKKRLGD